MRGSLAPWPTASPIVEKAIQEKHERKHHERVERARQQKTIENELPGRCLQHHDAKKELAAAERQYEIESENARLFQKLSAIEDLDSSKIIQPATSRPTVLGKPGIYTSHVGGHQTIDHINMDAGLNPASLHYAGKQPSSRPGSRANSRGPSPMRNSRAGSISGAAGVGTSVNGGLLWSGKLVRASVAPEEAGQSLETSGDLAAECSGSSIPALPPISKSQVLGTPPKPPGPAAARSRGPSPSRSMDAMHDGTPGARVSSSGGLLLKARPPLPGGAGSRSASPAPVARSADSALGVRAPSPSRFSSMGGLEPHPPMGAAGTPPRPPSVSRPGSRGPSPMRASVAASVSGLSAASAGSRGPSPVRRSLAGSIAALPPSTGDWKQDHEQRKQVLASVYLTGANLQPAAGSGIKAVRRASPGVSRSSSQANLTADPSQVSVPAADAVQPVTLLPRPGSASGSAAAAAVDGAAPGGAAARRYSNAGLDESVEL